MTDEKQRALELARAYVGEDRSGTLAAHNDAIDLATALLAATAELDELRRYVAHNDEEYQVMKDVLRAEHEACKQLRADLERCRAVCEAAVKWRETPPLNDCSTAKWVGALLDMERAIDAYRAKEGK